MLSSHIVQVKLESLSKRRVKTPFICTDLSQIGLKNLLKVNFFTMKKRGAQIFEKKQILGHIIVIHVVIIEFYLSY